VIVAFFNWDFAHVYAFNHDGTPFRENPPYLPRGLLLTTQNTLGHIVVADIDGNGTLNLIGRAGHLFPYSGCREKIFVWEPDGSPTPGFPIITPTPSDRVYSTPNTPVIDDIDGDGKVDVMLCGDYNEIFVWSLDYQYHADRMPWPKYQGDNNSGINPNRGEPTAAGDDPVALPVPFALLGNFPNPFNPSTAIRFSLDRAEVVCLEVYNILGQRVITLRNDFLPAGQYRVDWDGTNTAGSPVASGVYLVQLTAGDRYLTHKMMLVR